MSSAKAALESDTRVSICLYKRISWGCKFAWLVLGVSRVADHLGPLEIRGHKYLMVLFRLSSKQQFLSELLTNLFYIWSNIMLQNVLSWIIFLKVEMFLSYAKIKGPILKDNAKINRASKIFALPLKLEWFFRCIHWSIFLILPLFCICLGTGFWSRAKTWG